MCLQKFVNKRSLVIWVWLEATLRPMLLEATLRLRSTNVVHKTLRLSEQPTLVVRLWNYHSRNTFYTLVPNINLAPATPSLLRKTSFIWCLNSQDNPIIWCLSLQDNPSIRCLSSQDSPPIWCLSSQDGHSFQLTPHDSLWTPMDHSLRTSVVDVTAFSVLF